MRIQEKNFFNFKVTKQCHERFNYPICFSEPVKES